MNSFDSRKVIVELKFKYGRRTFLKTNEYEIDSEGVSANMYPNRTKSTKDTK